ncbi:MAG: DUF6273 domain-containing protein [bacterium]|nr:DUF6273 domain-containing protein [bacterium]
MSMSYGGYYEVKVRVKREELEKIEEAVKKVIGEYESNPPSYLTDRLLEFRIRDIKRVLDAIEEGKNLNDDYVVLDIEQDVDDVTHNFFGTYMLPIQAAVPDMEIAAKAYFSSDWPWKGYVYKSAEEGPLPFGDDMDFGEILRKGAVFPKDADWIPRDWRNLPRRTEKDFSKYVRSIMFGHYKGKPIEWFVLEEYTNGKLKLVSKYALDKKRYHEEDEIVTWEECSLRTWLNDTFLNQAFTKEEQEAIILSEVYNDFDNGFDEDQEDTEDKVFLLSTEEWIEGFWEDGPLPERDFRGGLSVPCGKCKPVDDEETYEVSYWLRTGEVVDSCECWDYDDCYGTAYFVRPVLWLNKKKAKSLIKIAHRGKSASYYNNYK